MKMFILGMLTMSIFATIGVILIDNNDDTVLGYILIGAAMWFTLGFCALIRKLKPICRDRNFRAIMTDDNENYYYCKSRYAKLFENCTEQSYKFSKFDKNRFNPLDWDEEYQVMGVGNPRYSPRKVWKTLTPIPKNEIKYAKKHQRKDF